MEQAAWAATGFNAPMSTAYPDVVRNASVPLAQDYSMLLQR